MYTRLAPSMDMAELHRLRRDHATIRAKLQRLDSTINGGSPDVSPDSARMQQGARPLCLSLARQLRAHIQQEERLATCCSMTLGRMGPDALERLALEHHVDQESLHIINQSLAHTNQGWVAQVGPLLLSLIASLQRQMDAQEVGLFPFMAQVLTGNGHSDAATGTDARHGLEPERGA